MYYIEDGFYFYDIRIMCLHRVPSVDADRGRYSGQLSNDGLSLHIEPPENYNNNGIEYGKVSG